MAGRNSEKGFTLVEMMMTVIILMTLAVITVPSVMQGVSRQDAAKAATTILGTIEFARVQASQTNLAYGITVTPSAGPGDGGSIQVYQGTNAACMYFLQANPDTGENAIMLRQVNVTRDFPNVRITDTTPTNISTSPICFKPDGRVLRVDNDLTPAIIPAVVGSGLAAGTAAIRIQRFDENGSADGVAHLVLIPFNGIARTAPERGTSP